MYNLKPFHKKIATALLAIFIPSLMPVNLLFASNNGPNAPEAQGFEPVTATDMVNLSSGDMSYVLPVMDVNGFPITMSYHGGIPLDLESTWVGLGWNLNTGAINRSLNATPDDWNGGNSLDFIKYQKTDEIYNLNVGVGVGKAAEVGVGMSWGSNKSLSGSVFASVGLGDHFGANASIDTDGNYSLGVSVGTKNDGGNNFGGGIGISGNVNGGGINVGVGAGLKTSDGLTMGMGTSLTGGGFSASLGFSGTEGAGKNTTGVAGSGSLSMSSFSQGDWDISSKGWYIPIQLGAVSLGFGKRKVTYSLEKAYSKKGFGILYNNSSSLFADNKIPDNVFADYQNRFAYGDAYEQVLPQPEKEFVGDYDAEREKLNFTHAGYDEYSVNATGVSGSMTPIVFDNATMFGMGYIGANPESSNQGKQRVYYHGSNVSRKIFGTNQPANIEFYFDGQFTQNRGLSTLTPVSNTTTTGDYLHANLSMRPNLSNERFQQGNYIEAYTNTQIKNGLANGLLSPANLPNAERTVSNKFLSDGIGGYKVTSPDGKTYHFSLPVYHFEEVKRTIYKDSTENHVSEKRQYTPYATHWLLTTITGPDYFDVNNNNIADEGDYGYWVRMDHGKWSDAYAWRSPTDKMLKEYSTNIEKNVGHKDFGHYQFGRKQLYYLDKIVSNTHTAYFVKDLRYDSVGTDLFYKYDYVSAISDEGFTNNTNSVLETGFTYKKQMQLMLKKIVLVKNDDANSFESNLNNSNNPLQLNVGGVSDYVDNYNLTFTPNGGFANEYGANYNVKINQEQNVIDVKDFENFDYSKAVKIVELGYNYNLAVKHHNYSSDPSTLSNGSPGVIKDTPMNPNHGKLTLKSIKFLGRNNYDYMPPYQFEYDGEFINSNEPYIPYPANAIAQRTGVVGWTNNYKNQTISSVTPEIGVIETPMENIRAKDEWGFFKDRPEVWTMTKIKTPTGASINFEHEEDDFFVEAFSRQYWMEGLRYIFSKVNGKIRITIDKEPNNTSVENLDLSKYFYAGQKCWLDLWACARHDYNDWGCKDRTARLDIQAEQVDVISVTSGANSTLVLECSMDHLTENNGNPLFNRYITANGGNGFIMESTKRGTCTNPPGCINVTDRLVFVYKLLSNKVPEDEVGGGIRVKSITLNDENNNSYKTSYYYNEPAENDLISFKNKNESGYKSSGITSYSPVKGTKFVPYKSELPSPGVMYEYVTMVAENESGQNLGETRYRFYVLRPVLDIFNENISMTYDDGTEMFVANVTDHNVNELQVQVGTTNVNGISVPIYESEYYHDTNKKIKAKTVDLHVNTSLVGQFRSVEEYNSKKQLVSKTEKHYVSGNQLKALADLSSSNENKVYRGSIKESFQSMKSVFNTDKDDNNPVLDKRLLSISSKEEYSSVLKDITNYAANGKVTETYKGSDPLTGAFNIVEKELANGRKYKIEKIPAYTKYPEMGSMVASTSNKNMLSQEVMTINSVQNSSGTWKTTNASITTWNDTWKYRNEEIGTDVFDNSRKVWRKHKTFAWKDDILNDGTYNYSGVTKANPQFNWGTGQPLSEKWQKLSEITRYTRWSSPIETKDINGNFASTKMGDKDSKVLISGNARYTEMYYSGAEYVKSGNLFDGEVKGANFRSQEVAHTGKYSVKAQTLNDKVFEVNGMSGDVNYYQNQDNYNATFRPGKYKVSFWAYKAPQQNVKVANNYSLYANLKVNGVEIPYSEVVTAGCWQLHNYVIDILPNTNYNISVGAKQITGQDFYDDFRMHPIASTISSYVYDQTTDQLSYMLDSNNIGSAYKYDNAGRLIATYTEALDHQPYGGIFVEGGFKIVSQYRQKYKGANDNFTNAPAAINNCMSSVYPPMEVVVRHVCMASFENSYKAIVTGGSGDFSYAYKWRKSYFPSIYTNYVNGNNTNLIPYVPDYCTTNTFTKKWDFVVKVTDNVTGDIVEYPFVSLPSGLCNYNIEQNDWADVQISKCDDFCGKDNYSFKIHLKDIGYQGNFKYEYANYDPFDSDLGNYFNSQTLNWIDVTSTNGKFCPQYELIEDTACEPYGLRKVYYFTYRITNLSTGAVSYFSPEVFIGDCLNSCIDCRPSYTNFKDNDYLKEGNVITKDVKGVVVKNVININEILD